MKPHPQFPNFRECFWCLMLSWLLMLCLTDADFLKNLLTADAAACGLECQKSLTSLHRTLTDCCLWAEDWIHTKLICLTEGGLADTQFSSLFFAVIAPELIHHAFFKIKLLILLGLCRMLFVWKMIPLLLPIVAAGVFDAWVQRKIESASFHAARPVLGSFGLKIACLSPWVGLFFLLLPTAWATQTFAAAVIVSAAAFVFWMRFFHRFER